MSPNTQLFAQCRHFHAAFANTNIECCCFAICEFPPCDKVRFVFGHQVTQRSQVGFHAAFDLFFTNIFRFRRSQSSFERQFLTTDFFDDVHGDSQCEVRFHHVSSHALACDFDLLGKKDLTIATKQWDVPHLT